MTCPTPEALLLARAFPSECSDVVRHVAACPACRRGWAGLAGVEDVVTLLGGQPAREALLDRVLIGIASAERPKRARARPVVEAGRGVREPALRGTGTAARHLVLQAEPFEVELAVLADPGAERQALVGQLHDRREGAPDRSAAFAETLAESWCLLSGPGGVSQADMAPDGSFRFGAIRAGRHDLVIELPELQILVPELDLGGGRAATGPTPADPKETRPA